MATEGKNLETEIKVLISELGSGDGLIRQKAREHLVEMGHRVTDSLVELLKSQDVTLRWEAAKALSEIADPASAVPLVYTLEDDEYDIRWLAAEGLIAVGHQALPPLLEALIENPESLYLREGTHHVLREIRKSSLKTAVAPLIRALEGTDAEEKAPVAAYDVLRALHRGQ
jgi:HEAT repeat protein